MAMNETTTQQVRRGGPEKCPKPCTECSEGDHHFSDAMMGFAEESPEHEAAKAGCQFWYVCKHCDAWREYTVDEEEREPTSLLEDVAIARPEDVVDLLGDLVASSSLANVLELTDLGIAADDSRVFNLLLSQPEGERLRVAVRRRSPNEALLGHASLGHVFDSLSRGPAGPWCTRCGSADADMLTARCINDGPLRVHRPRNGGTCPGCDTCGVADDAAPVHVEAPTHIIGHPAVPAPSQMSFAVEVEAIGAHAHARVFAGPPGATPALVGTLVLRHVEAQELKHRLSPTGVLPEEVPVRVFEDRATRTSDSDPPSDPPLPGIEDPQERAACLAIAHTVVKGIYAASRSTVLGLCALTAHKVRQDHAPDPKVAQLRQAMLDILAVCQDRQAFVMMGPRAFARAEKIAKDALVATETKPA